MLFNKSLLPLSAAIFLALDPKHSLAASIFLALGFKYREYLIGEEEEEDVEEYELEGEDVEEEEEDVEEYEPESVFETREILSHLFKYLQLKF